ncbi:AtpZ/AtpI family protein [Mesorhizobium xinjiangense]|uniref:AtpZ/AtpI family protein n=1 Tax=Mesorhizobium xinjiangense TaxID=2678685 RepID=UPI0012EE4C6E|nr:AtpZ/AtpI family protein [Mesorhizobium xinjiangense]
MAKDQGESGPKDPGGTRQRDARHGLEDRLHKLDAALAARRECDAEREAGNGKGDKSGYGQALKLSSEFIAGVVVGAGLGWVVDRLAGTSPWGLIVLLLLGFGAGVLNILRSTGQVAEFGQGAPRRDDVGAARRDDEEE